jgi:hypothetical protein
MTNDNLETDIELENTLISAPFAGRQAVFARIQQYLIDPSDRHALLVMGRKSIGKSAMLVRCQQVLGEHVIGCYLPLNDDVVADETTWLKYLYHHTNFSVQQHQLNIERLPDLPDDPTQYRDWFSDEYLFELRKLIRPHRRWIWLIDDIEYLIKALDNKQLPADSLDYLNGLLQVHLQLGVVITLDEKNEDQASQLIPLIDVNRVQRLRSLSAEESAELISRFVSHNPEATDDYIYSLTDGHPLLLQFMGDALQTIQTHPITKSEVDQIVSDVYTKADETYRTIWQNNLSQNDRLVLTTISSLLYDDPLIDLTAQRIENWSLETDFPMDITTINAGIRALDYQNLVKGSTADGIRIRAQLFQRWLIEHARMDKPETLHTRSINVSNDFQFGRNGLIVVVAVVIVVILLIALTQQSGSSTSIPLQPTVTLGTE